MGFTGKLVGGIIGRKRFCYDVWGDTASLGRFLLCIIIMYYYCYVLCIMYYV